MRLYTSEPVKGRYTYQVPASKDPQASLGGLGVWDMMEVAGGDWNYYTIVDPIEDTNRLGFTML